MDTRKIVPAPKTSFVKVKCQKCGNEQVVFSAPSMKVKCVACDSLLAEPGASKAKMHGKIVKTMA
jgi:small subunit ribosomal protein S27e